MCSFVAKGRTNEDVKERMWMHAENAHHDMLEDMTLGQKASMTKRMNKMLA